MQGTLPALRAPRDLRLLLSLQLLLYLRCQVQPMLRTSVLLLGLLGARSILC